MRVLITGARGCVGKALHAALVKRGHKLCGLDITELILLDWTEIK
jgi:nucleoside-diphosphate-sugar epimerase